MNDLRSITFRVFSQSLLLTVLIFFYSSVSAQQLVYFQKPQALTNCDATDKIQERILFEYGAVYLSKDAKLPTKCLFENETQIAEFVKSFKIPANKFSFGKFYLQPKAKESLQRVFDELGGYEFISRNCNGSTTCSGIVNDDWALRTFSDTVFIWFGSRQNSLTKEQWKSVTNEVKETDSLGKPKPFKNRPEMFSKAIPGGSQHNLGLAVDVNDRSCKCKDGICRNCITRICGDACVDALEKNGWFRTVRFDRFHYTYLGYKESELSSKGLKKVACSDTFTYWVPNAQEYKGYEKWRCKYVE